MGTKPTRDCFTLQYNALQLPWKDSPVIGFMIRNQVKKDPRVIFVEYKQNSNSDNQYIMTIQTTSDSCAEEALKNAIDGLSSEIWRFQDKIRKSLQDIKQNYKCVQEVPIELG